MTFSGQEQHEPHSEALQLPQYVAGMLDQSERDALERHVTQCPTCQRELETEKRLQPAIQTALNTRPTPSVQVLKRAKQKIAQTERLQEREKGHTDESTQSWAARLEQWIRQLFRPRWVPALAVLIIFIQGSVLQFLLTSPATTRPPGMEGPILERELPSPTGTNAQFQRVQIQFAPDLSLGEFQALLKSVHGTVIQGPQADDQFIIELIYSSQEQLHERLQTLKTAKAILTVKPLHPE